VIRSVVAIAVALVAAVIFVLIGSGPHRSTPARVAAWHGRRTGPSEPAALPRLGAAQAVEYDDVGDPFVLAVPGGVPGDRGARYVLFWTTDWRSNVPTAVSSDMVHWRRVADALPALPSWALDSRTMTWAPTAQRVKSGWVLYFSTVDAADNRECIGRAFSRNPVGPYADTSKAPLICQADLGGSIDPSVVRRTSGADALVWKNNGNAAGRPVSIWEQQLSANGMSLTGARHRLIGAGEPWEHGNVEGPALLAASHGGWWLFYSGGYWQSNTYNTGVAWCATLAGPCRPSPHPLLTGTATAVSPGGLDTFVASDGHLWASYSVFPNRPANLRAAMAEDRVLEIAPVLSH
jgi:beta-xylosidase